MISQLVKLFRKYSPFTKIVQNNVLVSFSDRLKGKNTLVFGASGGIGEGIARSVFNAGGNVILSGTNEIKLSKLSTEFNNAPYIIINLNNTRDIKEKIQKLLFEKQIRLDNMVYAAGIHGGSNYFTITEDEYDSVMNINLRGMFFSTQFISQYMIQHSIKGHILLLGSASGVKPAFSTYEISKWGVRGFTLGLARELVDYGIVVNSIAPGPVKTKMLIKDDTDELNWVANPTGRLCTPEEIGELSVFLLSDFGNYIIGDTVFISGGSGNINIDK